MTRLRKTLFLAAPCAAVLAVPVLTSAGTGDSDRDRMPDRWERRHGLSTSRDDARRDRDRDGARNVTEFRNATNPRDRDSDDDGVRDGRETGSIASFADDVLTITLLDGTQLRGRVTDATRIECEDGDEDSTPTATAATSGPSSNSGSSGSNSGPSSNSGSSADDDDADEDRGDDERACAPADLVAGARIEEAELTLTAGGPVWDEVELAK